MILFLNDVSGSEILLILLFILIFFGSKSIPGIAQTLGRTIRQIKDATDEIQTEIKKSAGDYKKDLNLDGIFKETEQDIRRPLDQMASDLDESIRYEAPTRTVAPPSETAQLDETSPITIGKEVVESTVKDQPVSTETTTEKKENLS